MSFAATWTELEALSEEEQLRKSNTAGFHLNCELNNVYIYMDIKCPQQTLESQKGQRGVRDDKLCNRNNVSYSGNGYSKSPDFAVQYIHVTKLLCLFK